MKGIYVLEIKLQKNIVWRKREQENKQRTAKKCSLKERYLDRGYYAIHVDRGTGLDWTGVTGLCTKETNKRMEHVMNLRMRYCYPQISKRRAKSAQQIQTDKRKHICMCTF